MNRSAVRAVSVDEKSGTSEWVETGIMVCHPPTDEGEEPIRRYYAEIVSLLASRPGPYVSITDASSLERLPNAGERKLHGELINAMSKNTGTRCVATVIVVRSSVVRAAITAITWLMDQAFPMIPAATLDEALQIARRELGRRS